MSDFPDLVDIKEAVFVAPKSEVVVDLAIPGETEGRFEEGAGDCRDGQRAEECCGVWRVDGG